MDKERLVETLKLACEKVGGQGAWARERGVSATYVSDVIQGRKEPGDKVLAALGLERVVTYRWRRGE